MTLLRAYKNEFICKGRKMHFTRVLIRKSLDLNYSCEFCIDFYIKYMKDNNLSICEDFIIINKKRIDISIEKIVNENGSKNYKLYFDKILIGFLDDTIHLTKFSCYQIFYLKFERTIVITKIKENSNNQIYAYTEGRTIIKNN